MATYRLTQPTLGTTIRQICQNNLRTFQCLYPFVQPKSLQKNKKKWHSWCWSADLTNMLQRYFTAATTAIYPTQPQA